MTTQEIHTYIDQGLQRMGYFVLDHFHKEEIDLHINSVIRTMVSAYHMASDFEKINSLIKTATFTLNLQEGSTFISLPKDYFALNSASAKAKVSSCQATQASPEKVIPVIISTPIDKDTTKLNPFSRTSDKKVLAALSNNSIEVFGDKRAIIGVIILNYTCKPETLNVISYPDREPSLLVSTHDQIVDLTIEKLKRIIESSVQ
jgi:hypothetical protein